MDEIVPRRGKGDALGRLLISVIPKAKCRGIILITKESTGKRRYGKSGGDEQKQYRFSPYAPCFFCL